MKIYVDVILFINFSFDLLLLLCTSISLKRNTKFYKLMLGAFIGSLSILFLFIDISSVQLFFMKVMVSVLMILVSFGFKDYKYFFKNMLYLYTSSIILGGFLYYLSVTFSYKNTGLVFYFEGLSINYIVLIVLSPIILFLYVKQNKEQRVHYKNCYKVILELENKTYQLNGYMDTGNNLVDPYFHKPIILINKKIDGKNKILVPYTTASGSSVLDCYRGKLKFKNKAYDVYVGFSKDICIEGIDCLLNNKMEEIC